MSLIKWNSQQPVTAQEEWNQWFDRFFGKDTSLFKGVNEEVSQITWSPRVDIIENTDKYTVHAELPGLKKEDIQVKVEQNMLSIHGERKREETKKDHEYHRVERFYGSFYRSFRLPEAVAGDKIKAELKDGILTVDIPKTEEAKPKSIEVKIS